VQAGRVGADAIRIEEAPAGGGRYKPRRNGGFMNLHKLIRQTHRWLSIAFTLAVLVNLVAVGLESNAVWIGLLALFPLILLMLSGLYLFALPYAARRRGG
jgi:hypothetical protein